MACPYETLVAPIGFVPALAIQKKEIGGWAQKMRNTNETVEKLVSKRLMENAYMQGFRNSEE
jgi:hypothetical protein